MLKKILLVCASAFLIVQSYKLFIYADNVKVDSLIITLIIAYLLNLFITGIFAFAGFALPTQQLFPESYYSVKHPNRLKKIYRLFNVQLFRKFLLATFWKSKKQQKKFFNGKFDGIQNLITQSKKSEFGHLLPFVLLCILSLYFIGKGRVALGLFTFIINWIGNWYPIILQRHHRMRIARIFQSIKK